MMVGPCTRYQILLRLVLDLLKDKGLSTVVEGTLVNS